MGRINTGGVKKKNGDNVATSSSVSGTTLKLTPPKGYYDGVSGTVNITDADYIEDNIKSGINLFGKVGTYLAGSAVSSTLVIIETGIESTYNTIGTSATKKKFTFSTGGNYRLNYLLRSNNVANKVDLTITKNGSPFLIVTGTTSTSYVEFNTDITVANGDYIELKITNSANGYTGYLDEVKIKSTLAVIKDIDIA